MAAGKRELEERRNYSNLRQKKQRQKPDIHTKIMLFIQKGNNILDVTFITLPI